MLSCPAHVERAWSALYHERSERRSQEPFLRIGVVAKIKKSSAAIAVLELVEQRFDPSQDRFLTIINLSQLRLLCILAVE